ncbi:MAG: hypothetical protein FJ290_20630 [Planctomycetes bacterium]|nr:hypothetical protein [Planctomycetota bacterium]
MAKGLPEVEVAVALITCDKKILAVYNPAWAAFTLPMTKRRQWKDPNIKGGVRVEDWRHAAARAAGEFLLQTIASFPDEPALEVDAFRQGDREGVVKLYHYKLYRVAVTEGTPLVPGLRSEWLTWVDLQNPNREPISPTARELLKRHGPI